MPLITINASPALLEGVILRPSDVLELQATTGESPEQALKRSAEVSTWWRAAVNQAGQVVAAFGVAPYPSDLPGVGSPWFLASEEIYQHPMQLLRHSKRWVELMQQQYPLLVNYVDVRHHQALKWVSWLGFTFMSTTQGVNGETLLQIIRR